MLVVAACARIDISQEVMDIKDDGEGYSLRVENGEVFHYAHVENSTGQPPQTERDFDYAMFYYTNNIGAYATHGRHSRREQSNNFR